MKILASVVTAALFVAVAMAAIPPSTADAHCLFVTPPGQGAPVVECTPGDFSAGWTGSPLFPGDHPGKGLIPGGPGDAFKISPSHGRGLVTACEAHRANGNEVVNMFGPGGPGCPHGQ